ncbi:MAG TPA: thiamine S protein [Thermosulfidibacter takaii]|uniref:Thiamine S protein n=1 Tax=Thermosulfidibacter takaii TaxID=412593 RepID=A0A7C0Y844_9BACT|nr:thiamine S protein [Thermosulfidibacter takaii]
MATITFEDKKWEVNRRMNVLRFLEKEGINPEEVLVLINGKVVTEDAVMEPQDEVKILWVLSWG